MVVVVVETINGTRGVVVVTGAEHVGLSNPLVQQYFPIIHIKKRMILSHNSMSMSI